MTKSGFGCTDKKTAPSDIPKSKRKKRKYRMISDSDRLKIVELIEN